MSHLTEVFETLLSTYQIHRESDLDGGILNGLKKNNKAAAVLLVPAGEGIRALAGGAATSVPNPLAFRFCKQGKAATGAEIGRQRRVAHSKLWDGQEVVVGDKRNIVRHEVGMTKHAIILDDFGGQGE